MDMIDDKKIEEAANLHRFELVASMHGSTLGTPMQCFEEVVDAETDLIENSFITGAKWAINKFFKDLWHPISDKPEEHTDIIYIDEDKDFWDINNYDSNNFDDSLGKGWESACRTQDIYKWAYKDDLFPKKGGEQ